MGYGYMNPYNFNKLDEVEENISYCCLCCHLTKQNCVEIDGNRTSYSLYNLRELFLWSLWTSHLELSYQFWKRLAHPIIAALVAYKILDYRVAQLEKHPLTREDCSHYSK